MSSTPEPGWYPDPTHAAAVRWWDGSAWTGRTRPAPPAATDGAVQGTSVAADDAPAKADADPDVTVTVEDELVRPQPARDLRRPLILAGILVVALVGAFWVLDPLGSDAPSAEATALGAALGREVEARADADACVQRASLEDCVAVAEQWRGAVAGVQDVLQTGSGACTQAVRDASGDAANVLGAAAQAMIDGNAQALAGLAEGRRSAEGQLATAGQIARTCA